jgi:hypothetical protein
MRFQKTQKKEDSGLQWGMKLDLVTILVLN